MSIILDGSTGIVSDSSASNPAMTAKGNGSDVEGYIQLNCRVNSHGVKLKSPPHSSGQSYTMILPDNQVAANKFLCGCCCKFSDWELCVCKYGYSKLW